MSDETNPTIYDIIHAMGDKDSRRSDMEDVKRAVLKVFTDKYIGRALNIARREHEKSVSAPSNEARLLMAFKPFIGAESNKSVDDMINNLTLLETIKKLMPPGKNGAYAIKAAEAAEILTDPAAETETDESIRPDGVYDVDRACLARRRNNSGALTLMMAMGMFLKR